MTKEALDFDQGLEKQDYQKMEEKGEKGVEEADQNWLDRLEKEKLETSPEFQRIRNIVRENWWKHMEADKPIEERTRTGGKFVLEEGIKDVAKTLEMNGDLVKECIVKAFTRDCLVKVRLDKDRKPVPLTEALNNEQYEMFCLIEVIQELGNETEVWTLGPIDWQKKKAELVELDRYISKDHWHMVEGEKISELEKILKEVLKREGAELIHVYVVDDSDENIKAVKELAEKYKGTRIVLHDYQLKINDSEADGTAFYTWITKERVDNPNLILVLDFDQVIADTNGALLGPACENILRNKFAPKLAYSKAA